MKRFVALPRGINVGSAKRVAMAQLRRLLEEGLGFAHARTLLNSGNVVFDASVGTPKAHAQAIHQALAKTLGVDAQVVVKSAAEIERAIVQNPLLHVADNASRLMLVFVQQPVILLELRALAAQDWAAEALAVGKECAYMWLPEGVIDSPLAKAVNRVLGERATVRNWATVLKLQALLQRD